MSNTRGPDTVAREIDIDRRSVRLATSVLSYFLAPLAEEAFFLQDASSSSVPDCTGSANNVTVLASPLICELLPQLSRPIYCSPPRRPSWLRRVMKLHLVFRYFRLRGLPLPRFVLRRGCNRMGLLIGKLLRRELEWFQGSEVALAGFYTGTRSSSV